MLFRGKSMIGSVAFLPRFSSLFSLLPTDLSQPIPAIASRCTDGAPPGEGEERMVASLREGRHDTSAAEDECSRIHLATSSYAALVRSCGENGALSKCRQIHSHLLRNNGLVRCTYLANLLIDSYGKCGQPAAATALFDNLESRNSFTWTAVINAFCWNQGLKGALALFRRMEEEGVVRPGRIVFVILLTACQDADADAFLVGKELYACVIDCSCDSDTVVGNSLLTLFGKCGRLDYAQRLFERMSGSGGGGDVVTWNVMISACSWNGCAEESVNLLRRMRATADSFPNRITFVSAFDACANTVRGAEEGKELHAHFLDIGIFADVVVETAIANMYAHCGSHEEARCFFDRMRERNVVTWSAMVSGFASRGCIKEALDFFHMMLWHGVKPNEVSFVGAFHACADLTAVAQGKEIHVTAIEKGICLRGSAAAATALFDMYAKCGLVDTSRRVFEKLEKKDLKAWTAIINAYAVNGCGKEALELFRRMKAVGTQPTEVTFISLLSACSHAGLVDEGLRVFDSMKAEYGLPPAPKHYQCLIDLLGRAGRLEAAELTAKSMPSQNDTVAWYNLLTACSLHGDVARGKRAAGNVLKSDPCNVSAYVLLSNMYARAGMWDDATRLRKEMDCKGLKKPLGRSWIMVKGKVHEFTASGGDTTQFHHPCEEEIHAELCRLDLQIREAGYSLNNVEEEEEEEKGKVGKHHHSEKLALAFGLISTPSVSILSIVNKLRMCQDCHTDLRCISRITGRLIIVKDAVRFHHFEDGLCSCGNYW